VVSKEGDTHVEEEKAPVPRIIADRITILQRGEIIVIIPNDEKGIERSVAGIVFARLGESKDGSELNVEAFTL
jgi:hypothetical protein